MFIGKCIDVFRGIILVGWLRGVGTTWEDLSLEEFVMGKRNSMKNSMKRNSGFSIIIIKKTMEEINIKKFFQLKVRSSIKSLKRTEDYYAYEGFFSS